MTRREQQQAVAELLAGSPYAGQFSCTLMPGHPVALVRNGVTIVEGRVSPLGLPVIHWEYDAE